MIENMVYCYLKEIKEDSAIYYAGRYTSDITGEVEFFKEFKNPVIIKQPKTEKINLRLVCNVAVKYKDKFSKGEFPEKTSYEPG